jgi:hypothetical protein
MDSIYTTNKEYSDGTTLQVKTVTLEDGKSDDLMENLKLKLKQLNINWDDKWALILLVFIQVIFCYYGLWTNRIFSRNVPC